MTNEELDAYFDTELLHLRGMFQERWRLIEQQAPSVIYHYTDLIGLTGILRSGHLWATLTSCLNDTVELLHASALLRDVLGAKAANAHPLFREMLLPEVARDFDFARQDILQVFVSSLTARRDNPDHWKKYAGAGKGVALGFQTAELLQFGTQEDRSPYFALSQVLYDHVRQREFLIWGATYWFERMSRKFRGLALKVRDLDYLRASMLGNLSVVCGYLPLMKKDGWAPEDEWRLGHGHDPKRPDCSVKYRGANRVPYVELDLTNTEGRLPLVEIIVGPAFANELSTQAVHEFLHLVDYDGVGVVPSAEACEESRTIYMEAGRPTSR